MDRPSPVQVGARIAVLNDDNIWSEGLVKAEDIVDDDLAVTILYDNGEEKQEFLERDNYKYQLLLRPEGPNLSPPWDKRLLKKWQEDGALFTSLGMQGPKGPQVMITRVGESRENDVYDGKAQQGLVYLDNGTQVVELPFSGIYRVLAAGARGYWGQASKVEATFKWMRGEKIRIIVGQKYGGATWMFKDVEDEKPLLVAAGGGMRGNGKNPSTVMDFSGVGGSGKHPYGSGAGWREPGEGDHSGQPPGKGGEGGGCGGFGGGGDACGGGFNGGYDQGGGWSFIDEDVAIDADEDLYGAGFNMREGFVKIVLKKSEWRARINPLVDQEKRIPDEVPAPQPPPIEYMTWAGPELWDGTVNMADIQRETRPQEEKETKFDVTDDIIKKLGSLHTSLCDRYHIPDDEFRIDEDVGKRWARKLVNHSTAEFTLDVCEDVWGEIGNPDGSMPKEDFVEFMESSLMQHMKQMSSAQTALRITNMIQCLQADEDFEPELEELWPDVADAAADHVRHKAASKTPVTAAAKGDDEDEYDDVEDDGEDAEEAPEAAEEDYEDDAYEDEAGAQEGAEDDYEDEQEFPDDGAEDAYEDAEDAGDEGDYDDQAYEEAGAEDGGEDEYEDDDGEGEEYDEG